jgi:hypothetical protein
MELFSNPNHILSQTKTFYFLPTFSSAIMTFPSCYRRKESDVNPHMITTTTPGSAQPGETTATSAGTLEASATSALAGSNSAGHQRTHAHASAKRLQNMLMKDEMKSPELPPSASSPGQAQSSQPPAQATSTVASEEVKVLQRVGPPPKEITVKQSTIDDLKIAKEIIWKVKQELLPNGAANILSDVVATKGMNLDALSKVRSNPNTLSKSVELGVGCCDEGSSLIYESLAKFNRPISRVKADCDHCAIVVGEKNNAGKFVDPQNCIVIDLWQIFARAHTLDQWRFHSDKLRIEYTREANSLPPQEGVIENAGEAPDARINTKDMVDTLREVLEDEKARVQENKPLFYQPYFGTKEDVIYVSETTGERFDPADVPAAHLEQTISDVKRMEEMNIEHPSLFEGILHNGEFNIELKPDAGDPEPRSLKFRPRVRGWDWD